MNDTAKFHPLSTSITVFNPGSEFEFEGVLACEGRDMAKKSPYGFGSASSSYQASDPL